MSIVLASASPRRHDLLGRLGIAPIVRAPLVDEVALRRESPLEHATRLARDKVRAVSARGEDLVIAADTVVTLDGDVLGKPADADGAAAGLRRLSGATHEVVTGVAVRHAGRVEVASETTAVTFRDLTDGEIDWYVRTGDPMDKAGGYGLQGPAAAFVANIDGSDTNVIGLPLSALVVLARVLGVDLLAR